MKPFMGRSVGLSLCALFVLSCGGKKGAPPPSDAAVAGDADPAAEDADPLVHAAVTAFISVRCPHAAETLRDLLQIKKEMGDSLELHLGYIGALDAEGKIDRSIGEDEIKAASAQICAGMSANEKSWYAFLGCLYEGDAWRSFPLGFDTCTEKAGIDRTNVDACLHSGDGEKMLAKAYNAASASRIEASPTVIVGRHFYAGKRDADSFRRYLCYTAGEKETRPAVCDTVSPPSKIAATMLYDLRCNSALKCDVEGEVAVLEKLIPGFKLERLEFSSEKGRALYDRIVAATPNFRELPIILIDGAIDGQDTLKEMLGEYLMPFEAGYMFALGGGWDPLAEICDNGKDDNGNGAVDCVDEACGDTRGCREEKKGRLDLFIMSGCPYAVDLLPHVDKLLAHFGRDRKALDFHLQFIGDIDENGALRSMHGEPEVAENMRMICAEDIAPDKYKFMEYVLCRAAAFESTDWEACVPSGMSKTKLKSCAEGKKGTDLLKASFALAAELGVEGSPSWILHNKEDMEARRFPDMVVEFCQKNDVPACKKTVAEEPPASSPPSAPKQCGQ